MGERPFFSGGVGQLPHYCHLDNRHNLATFYAQDGAAQDVLGLGIDNGFHKTARFASFQGTGHGIHGQFCHTDGAPLFSGLVFRQANTPKLGIDEDGIGNKAILRAGVAMLKQIGARKLYLPKLYWGEKGQLAERRDLSRIIRRATFVIAEHHRSRIQEA